MVSSAISFVVSMALVTPVTGYSVSIDRSKIFTDDVVPYFEETIEVRGQNNRSLTEAQMESAGDAAFSAACKPNEEKLMDRISFEDGVVIVEMVCSLVEG